MRHAPSVMTLTAIIAIAWPGAGHAQEQPAPPQMQPPGYTTPLYQQTQPSYVPQSVALSGPRIITDWTEGEPVPSGYHPSSRIRKGPVIAGAVVFGVFYLFSTLGAAVGADSNQGSGNPEAALWIPCIGPFIQMASTSTAVGNWLLAIDGLAQSGGLALLIYGIAAPRTVLVRNDLGLRIAPTLMPVGQGGQGVGVVGSF
jgi:hypothetical protein